MFERKFVKVLDIHRKLCSCYKGNVIEYLDERDNINKYAAIPNNIGFNIWIGDIVEILKADGLKFDGYCAMVIGK